MQHDRTTHPRLGTALVAMMLTCAPARASAQHGRPSSASGTSGSSAQQQSMGVWEPVSYGQDLELTDVFFVTPSVGWVAGAAGTILSTRDAGATWSAQLGGDPQSREPAIGMLRFVDGRHGWAVQRSKLLRTSDGAQWEEVGTIPSDMREYAFISPTRGVALAGNSSQSHTIYLTTDAGGSWKPVAECRATLQVNGLTQNTDCWLMSVSFPTPMVGYAGGGHPMCGGCGGPPLMMKTEDGGETWRVMVGPGDLHTSTIDRVVFLDERTGFVHLAEGKIFVTRDGGATWRGLVGSGASSLAFTDPEVAWAFHKLDLTYSVDAGEHWSTRAVRFPAYVNAFSLPRRDRAFVVGDHGMIFRYSVVPASTVPPRAITSPAMPSHGGALDDAMQSLRTRSDALAKAVQSAGSTPGDAASASTGSAPGDARTTGAGSDASFVERCCAANAAALESSVEALPGAVSSFVAKGRTVNLVIAGLQLTSRIPTQLSSVRAALKQLDRAAAQSDAMSALAELTATVDSLRTTVRFALLDEPPLMTGVDASAVAPVATVVGDPASSGTAATTGAATDPAAAPNASGDSAASKTKDALAKKAKGLLKKKIHVP